MTPRQLLLILRARWMAIAVVLSLVLVATAAISWSMPKQYVASTTLVVDIKDTDRLRSSSAPDLAIPGYLATQAGIARSDRVITRVIDAERLMQDGQMLSKLGFAPGALPPAGSPAAADIKLRLARLLAKYLDVRASKEGNLISIAFTWTDGAQAARIANAFAQAYIETNLELKVEPAKQFAQWFGERDKALRDNLERAQERLSSFQRSSGVIAATAAQVDIETARLNELSSQLTAIQGLRADSNSRERQAGSGQDVMPEVLASAMVINLKSDLARLQAKREEMAGRLGENHPELQRIEAEVAAVSRRVNAEISRVGSSITAANQINSQREAQIKQALLNQRQRVLQLTGQRDQIAVLQNDVATAQKTYDNVTQRLAQTNLESQTQTTNVMVISPAQAPLGADRPRKAVNMLLALVFGSFLGVGFALMREIFNPRVHGEEDLRNALGFVVLGVIEPAPRMSTQRLAATAKLRRGAWALKAT